MLNSSNQGQTDSEDTNMSSDDVPCSSPEMESIFAQNQQLQSDNEILKNQLQRALDFENELKTNQKNLYDENLNLKTQLLESGQSLSQIKQRLQLSQQKCQEAELQASKLEISIQKANEEKQALLSQLSTLNDENSQLTTKYESLYSSINDRQTDENAFLLLSSKMFDQSFSNYDEVVSYLQNLKKDHQRLLEVEKNFHAQEDLNNQLKAEQEEKEKILKKNSKYKKKIQQLNQVIDENNKDNNEKIADFTENKKQYEEHQNSLIQQNQNLTAQIENFKEQVNSLQIRIDQMKQDRDLENKKHQVSNEAKDKRISELKGLLANPLRAESNETQKMIQELSKKKCEVEELSQTLSDTKNENDKTRTKLAKVVMKLKKLKAENTQIKKHFESISKKRTSNDEKVSQVTMKNAELAQQLDTAQIENENLRTQLKAAMASHAEGESAWNSKAQENKRLQSSLSSVENIVDHQRSELESHQKERKQMIELIHKMNQMILYYETNLNDELKKNKDLSAQVKRFNKQMQKYQELADRQQNESRLIDVVKDSVYEKFDERLRFAFIQILNDDSFTAAEKLKKVFEVINNSFKDTDEKVTELSKENTTLKTDNNSFSVKIGRFSSLISSTLAAFRKILGAEPNQTMTDFITIQSSKLESAMREIDDLDGYNLNNNMNNLCARNDFLFNGSLDERRRAIEKVAKIGFDSESTFDLFSLQSLTNIELWNEVERTRQTLAEQEDQINQISKMIGTRDLSKLVSKLKALKSENKKLIKIQSKIDSPAVFGLEKQVKDQAEKIQTLQNDLRSVVNDATTLQNELDMKLSQYSTLEKAHAQLMIESSDLQSKHLREVNEFESIIDTRNREVRDLTIKLTQVTSESNELIDRLKKSNEQLKELNEKRTAQFKRTFALLQEKKKNKEEQLNARLKSQEVHFQEELNKNKAEIEQLKTKITETTAFNTKQTTEKDDLNRRLASSLKKSEERNQKMTNEISKLTIVNKTLESQVKSTQDQMKRETQLLNTQFTFDTMTNETKFQERLTSLKTKMQKEKNDLVFLVLSELDEIDDFDADEIDEETFKHTITRIGKEYRKQKIANQNCL
ncbi:hypothetical protein TRFO_14596 [Tritrichomonas foetus]|uniref:Uncharacterized protein n=1 Tax=Tritrichomonas foetus TaxID=1144522 RepID=A0A1J4KZ27_9EUKA|nr:hypothetical protein TRFO_14596 [Tritrichomonas foetus]|eukprot:OHT14948.1 hypothetical protein TRFO_14596 [Tritrichomonas foetus]